MYPAPIIFRLVEHLKEEHAFWSYREVESTKIDEDLLIEKVLLHLDIEDVVEMLKILPFEKISRVWHKSLLPLTPGYYSLNRFYAFWLFGIKDPNKYIENYLTSYKKQQSEGLN